MTTWIHFKALKKSRTSNSILCVVFLDIKAAYDTIKKDTLNEILKYTFGDTKITKFFENFLSQRHIGVVYKKILIQRKQ